MHKFRIYEAYGAWIADNGFGTTIWAQTREELMGLFNHIGFIGVKEG